MDENARGIVKIVGAIFLTVAIIGVAWFLLSKLKNTGGSAADKLDEKFNKIINEIE